jgi:hypothetical protein
MFVVVLMLLSVDFLTGAVERRRIGTASVDVAYTTI